MGIGIRERFIIFFLLGELQPLPSTMLVGRYAGQELSPALCYFKLFLYCLMPTYLSNILLKTKSHNNVVNKVKCKSIQNSLRFLNFEPIHYKFSQANSTGGGFFFC
jgi:hypothetical protein